MVRNVFLYEISKLSSLNSSQRRLTLVLHHRTIDKKNLKETNESYFSLSLTFSPSPFCLSL